MHARYTEGPYIVMPVSGRLFFRLLPHYSNMSGVFFICNHFNFLLLDNPIRRNNRAAIFYKKQSSALAFCTVHRALNGQKSRLGNVD